MVMAAFSSCPVGCDVRKAEGAHGCGEALFAGGAAGSSCGEKQREERGIFCSAACGPKGKLSEKWEAKGMAMALTVSQWNLAGSQGWWNGRRAGTVS